MSSPKYFVCKQCGKEFDISTKRHCPKCSSFNIKPLPNEKNVVNENVSVITSKQVSIKAEQPIERKKKVQKKSLPKIQVLKVKVSKLLYASWLLIAISGISFVCKTYEWALPALFLVWPFLLIVFVIPILIYQIIVK